MRAAPTPEAARRTNIAIAFLVKATPSEKMPTSAKPTMKTHLGEEMSAIRPPWLYLKRINV